MSQSGTKTEGAGKTAGPGFGLSRPVLSGVEALRRPGNEVSVEVRLKIGRQRFEGTAEGVGLETMELRLAAQATMEAIHEAVGHPRFQLVGIKRMHAFDADVILVALKDRREDGRRYIGAVPVRSTLVHGAAAAVLDATNRIITAPPEKTSGK